MENLCWFGELEQQEGILSCSFSCGYFEMVGKDTAFVSPGFSTGGEELSQQLLLDSRICLLFSSSNLLHFFVSQ